MGVTLPQLRALVTVVDRASFTDAAAQLGISQSAVSHAVSGLEKEVGGRVLQRDGGVALTVLGHRVLEHARAALASVVALESAVRQDGTLAGTVRLGAVATVCQGLLPELLPLWAAKLPNVDVQIYEGDDDEMPEWLEAGVVEAAILVEPSPAPAGSKLVATDEFAAVVRGDHPLAGLDGIPLAELAEDGLIVSTGGCEGHVKRMHDDEGLPYAFSHRVREMSTLFRMVEQGMGVAIVPSLGRGMLPGDLVMKPLAKPRPRRLVLSGPASRPWHPLAQALVDAI
jgi:DNA-binding transcriptional LysR family regulator